jgi:diamine N-acetyltransferase
MMSLLENNGVRLRALEPSDIETLYRWENDTAVWGVSHTLLPFSRHMLEQFILGQAQDIYQTRQARFVVEHAESGRPVGVIDLFDFDPFHLRAGVGILIHDIADRRKGYASAALGMLVRYGFEVLRLHQLYADVPAGNEASLRLFERHGFVRCGVKKEWLRTPDGWEDEASLQLIN